MSPLVSILMPTYKQASFIRRALASLSAQSLLDWELIMVNDGSPDETHALVEPYLADPRIRYYRMDINRGLGAALNFALAQAQAPLIAYLPSDDVYYSEHIQTLVTCLEEHPASVAACSGIRHHYNRSAPGQIPGYPLQLVQVMHRRVPQQWVERDELTTDDLERMYWAKLRPYGGFLYTQRISCEWVNHPQQRHKLLREPTGGINPYRMYYEVKQPLRVHTTMGNY